LGIWRLDLLGADVSSSDILDGHVLDVETDVVSGETLGDLLVVHLDGLDFGGNVGGGELDNHTSLDDTGLNSTDGDCADTSNLVDILEGQSEGLVGGSRRGVNGVNGVEEGDTLGGTGLGLLGPSLVPRHVGGSLISDTCLDKDKMMTYLQHIVSVPSRDGDEGDGLGVVSDLLDETGGLLDNFVESVLGPLAGVHLVASDDELPDTEGEGEQSVLSGLTVLGDT
jgi:hypothetical protein